ncbi:curlin repeat-containing protein [Methylobacterium durans]|uniref:curlin repeat-containing protein n=1 Tax=Methylobacterium durans TaxID=2202825 RepID=UPI002AFE51CF|nr:curlin repeat-containing protein [Methylobacterium durans]MEA1832540.1 curlin repeat-containing protein [Methylobacterium durans]
MRSFLGPMGAFALFFSTNFSGAAEVYVPQAAVAQQGQGSHQSPTNTLLASPVSLASAQAAASAPVTPNAAQMIQIGAFNSGTITQSGGGNTAAILQQGRGNVALISQTNAAR